jgi:hypothetical protein
VNPYKTDMIMMPSQMLDARPALITDFRHRNRDETDVIMAKIREMTAAGGRAGPLGGRQRGQAAGPGGVDRRRRGRRARAGPLY